MLEPGDLKRRSFLAACASLGLGGTLLPGVLWATRKDDGPITPQMIATAEDLAGLEFTPEQRELMAENLNEYLENYQALRELDLPNGVPPALVFDPRAGGVRPPEPDDAPDATWTPPDLERPASDEDLAFLSVAELSGLVRRGQVTSTELTRLYLGRLERYDPLLEAVVTLTAERALAQAAERDRELAAGRWRGPLHGIPWGAKDLLAVEGYPTTWGAMPYRDQVIDETAEVVRRLDDAGAVLVAKLTLGALAWGDVWFGGQTRNPWNTEQGSSGSSAGPGSAVAAGLVGFAIGSETLGSIVSPSTRNGVSGLRPTFGVVSRRGAMALSWSMDKLGPMARSAEDCALVQAAIQGYDPEDPSCVEAPFGWDPAADTGALRIGYLASAFEEDYAGREADAATLDVLRGTGLDLREIELPDFPVDAMLLTLEVEAAAAFDGLTRSGGVDQLVRQQRRAWPNVFRAAQFVPAVSYVQANRARMQLMQAMARLMEDVDVFVAPSFGGDVLGITNLTGHPCVVVPNAFHTLEDDPDSPRRRPGSISFIGRLYRDWEPLLVAHRFQQATEFHRLRPPLG